MKRIILLLLVVCSAAVADAQNYELVDSFMTRYSNNYVKARRLNGVSMVGRKCPDFYLNSKLNSRKLRGKFILLNFWATWCSGCRLLSIDLDTVMVRKGAEYRDIQVIGVDSHEDAIDKGYDPEEWWSEKGITFPTVGGDAADALCDTLHGSHPSMFLIDNKGIVRGQWAAWSPGTADEARVAAWALDVVPRDGIKADSATVEKYIAQGRTLDALYLTWLLPDDFANAYTRFHALVRISSGEAQEYIRTLRSRAEKNRSGEDWRPWNADSLYVKAMSQIVEEVAGSDTEDSGLLLTAQEAAKSLYSAVGAKRQRMYASAAVLGYRYGKCVMQQNEKFANRIVNSPRNYGMTADDAAEAKSQMERSGMLIKVDPKQDEMSAFDPIDAETREHMTGLNDTVTISFPKDPGITGTVFFPQKMRPGMVQKFEVDLNIPDGWHGYPNNARTKEEGFIPTTLTAELPEGFTVVGESYNYPEDMEQLKGHFYIFLKFKCPTVKELKGQKEFPVTLKLRYQVCNDGSCMPPSTVEIKGTIKSRK